MARLDSRVLLDFLEEVDKEMERKITLIAVGGTALTLLGKKIRRKLEFFLLKMGAFVFMQGNYA